MTVLGFAVFFRGIPDFVLIYPEEYGILVADYAWLRHTHNINCKRGL